MTRVFVIADLHLGHKKCAALRGFQTTEDHDKAIVNAWNKVVTKRDTVYVLGDIFKLDCIPLLNGNKKLALGNHDLYPIIRYTPFFSKIRSSFEFDNCLLTHIPIHPGQFHRYEMNIHGHTHNHFIDDPRYIPVSVEHCSNMEPLPLQALIDIRKHIANAYAPLGNILTQINLLK